MRRAILTTVVLLQGCISPVIRVHSEQPEAAQLVEEAGAILGVPTKMMRKPGRGITSLSIERTRKVNGEQLCGTALEKVVSVRRAFRKGKLVTCTPKAWACATVTFVVHELGHVYGLRHIACPDGTGDKCEENVMRPAPGRNTTVTAGQTAVVEVHAIHLERVCR